MPTQCNKQRCTRIIIHKWTAKTYICTTHTQTHRCMGASAYKSTLLLWSCWVSFLEAQRQSALSAFKSQVTEHTIVWLIAYPEKNNLPCSHKALKRWGVLTEKKVNAFCPSLLILLLALYNKTLTDGGTKRTYDHTSAKIKAFVIIALRNRKTMLTMKNTVENKTRDILFWEKITYI